MLSRETDPAEALAAAGRIRRAIAPSPLPGVAGCVDRLLYEAKETGRNRVCGR